MSDLLYDELSTQNVAEDGRDELRRLQNIFWALYGSARKILIYSVIIAIAAYLFSYTFERKYTSVAQVMLDTRVIDNPEYEPFVSGLPTSLTSLESELEVLRSTDLIEEVVQKMDLQHDPEFSNSDQQKLSLSPIKFLRNLKNNIVSAFSGLDENPTSNSGVDLELEETIQLVADAREVEQVGDISAVFEIHFTSADRSKAAAIANALAEEYLRRQTVEKQKTLDRSQRWLSERTDHLQEILIQLSQQLESHAIAAPYSPEEYATIKGNRLTSERRLNKMNERLSLLNADIAKALRLLDDGMVEGAEALLREISKREGGTLAPTPLDIEAEIEHLVAESKRQSDEIASLEIVVDELRAAQALQVQHTAEDRRIQHEILVTETIYQNFLSQLSVRAQKDKYLDSDGRIIEYARPQKNSSEPKRTLFFMVAFLLTSIVGSAVVVWREIFNTNLRTIRDFEEITGQPLAAVMPEVDVDIPLITSFISNGRFSDWRLAKFGEKLRSKIEADIDEQSSKDMIHDTRDKEEPHGEKILRKSSVKETGTAKPPKYLGKIIAGASAAPGDGQSSSLLILASSFAAGGRHTLLLDCDLWNSPYSDMSKVKVGELEKNRLSIRFVQRMIVHTRQKGLDILPAPKVGVDSPEHDAWKNGLFSENAKSILLRLAQKYDVILLDIPPLLTNEDAAELMTFADSVILFLRWNKASRQTASGVSLVLSDANIIPSNFVATRVEKLGRKYYNSREFAFAES